MLVSGVIKEIHDYDMDVSLPNGITGYLPITNISNSYTELLHKLTSGEDAAIDEVWLPSPASENWTGKEPPSPPPEIGGTGQGVSTVIERLY